MYKYAKEGALILALTDHEAATPWESETGSIKLPPYLAHAEDLNYVPDGYHVLVFGGEYKESDYESGIDIYIPNWWFLNDGNFETVGNPIKFIPLIPN